MLADAGVENVNAQVDELIHTGVLRPLLAFRELKFSPAHLTAWVAVRPIAMAITKHEVVRVERQRLVCSLEDEEHLARR